jgi:hypothetical protein
MIIAGARPGATGAVGGVTVTGLAEAEIGGLEGLDGGTTAGRVIAAIGAEIPALAEGAVAVSWRCVIAFSTSPGREMLDKSILVLMPSSARGAREDLEAAVCPSEEERSLIRTFSASCSSRELECVFFSVTPTSSNTSRIALLFTSSSLAKSLIRTLLIRPFVYSAFALGLHRGLTEFILLDLHPHRLQVFGCHDYSFVSLAASSEAAPSCWCSG